MANSLELHTNGRIAEINGKAYRLDFDMMALSQAEQIYFSHYGRSVNISEIIAELVQVKMSAVMALCYGALLSAGEKLSWETFSKKIFTYENFDPLFGLVSEAISAMFASEEDAGGGTEKN